MGKKLVVGDLVQIRFDPKDNCVTYGMRRYNGENAIVSKVKGAKLALGSSMGSQYELLGVESMYGVPYTFTRDMLREVE